MAPRRGQASLEEAVGRNCREGGGDGEGMEPPRALVPGRSALLAAVRAYLPVHSVGMGAMDSVSLMAEGAQVARDAGSENVRGTAVGGEKGGETHTHPLFT